MRRRKGSPSMATIALDIHGQGVAVQSYKHKGTLSSATWLAFVVSPCAFWATSLTPRMRFRTLSWQPSHTWTARRTSEDVHVAHGHRDQCRSHEVASPFTA